MKPTTISLPTKFNLRSNIQKSYSTSLALMCLQKKKIQTVLKKVLLICITNVDITLSPLRFPFANLNKVVDFKELTSLTFYFQLNNTINSNIKIGIEISLF